MAHDKVSKEFGSLLFTDADMQDRLPKPTYKKLKQVMDGILAMASLSKSLLGYRKAGDSADTSAAIAGVNAKEREALANAANDSERAVISANAALERAKIKAAESTRAATADLAE